MIWITIALWLFLVIGIIVLIKRHNIVLNQSEVKLNKNYQRKVDELEKEYQSKTEKLEVDYKLKGSSLEQDYIGKEANLKAELSFKEQELSKKKQELAAAIENKKLVDQYCNELKQFGEQQVQEQIKKYEEYQRQQAVDKLNKEFSQRRFKLEEELNIFKEYSAECQFSLLKEIDELKVQLEDFKGKRDAINEAIVHEKEIREQQDFYRVVLSDADKEDIQILNTIEMRLRNRESLYKLILDVFYKKPLDDMLNRVLEGKEFCGIYRITNLKTNESYIGKSTNIKNRFKQHIRTAIGLDGVARTKIHSAMKEYGIDNFSFEVLEKCTKETYSEREKYWINFYETNIYGYNIQK